MDLRTPFINDAGRLRSGWRIVIFIFVFLSGIKISDLLVLRINWGSIPHGYQLLDLFARIFLLLSSLLAGDLCTRLLHELLPSRSLALTSTARWFCRLLIVSIIGYLSLSLAVAIAAAAGGLRFT